MRVLFINPVGVLGGAEQSLLDLIAGLRESRPDFTVGLISCTPGPLLAGAQALGAHAELIAMPERVASLGDSKLRLAGEKRSDLGTLAELAAATPEAALYTRRLGRAIDRFSPELVHSNGMKSHLLTALLRRRRWPLLWHVHDFLGERPVMSRVLRTLQGRASGAIANSRAVAEDLRGTLPRLQVDVMLNAVDLERFSPGPGRNDSLDALASLPHLPGAIRVGLVGTYARWKGHQLFLEAARRVFETAKVPVRFYLVGGPLYVTGSSQFTEPELRESAQKLEISDVLGLVPFQTDTPEVYRALDVVVHASTRPEPFGLVIAEAMACGRPVVVSREGGATELFEEGVDGLGFTPRSVSELADRITQLVHSPALREKLGRAGRAAAERKFSRLRLGRELLACYRRWVTVD